MLPAWLITSGSWSARLAPYLLSIGQFIAGAVGFEIRKDGVSINWRRVLFWSLLAPITALVGGRIVAVFRDCITLFQIWSGDDTNFSLGVAQTWITTLFPVASSPKLEFCYQLLLAFGVDMLVATSLQFFAARILLKNFDRFCASITAVIHTMIAVAKK